jgi:hypothetical protein
MEDAGEYKKPWQFQEGNPGRPKGAKNRLAKERKEKIETLLNLMDEELKDYLKTMKGGEKMRIWVDLQEYVLPKQNRTTMEVESEDQITKIIFEVRDKKPDGEEG